MALARLLHLSRIILAIGPPAMAAAQPGVQPLATRVLFQRRRLADSVDKSAPISKEFHSLKDRINLEATDYRTTNAFKLFNIEQRFNINKSQLQREMFKLQNILHPDRFVTKSEQIRDKSAQLSALVNQFYRIICDPYERAKYLLSLACGQTLEEVEEDLDKLVMDHQFLEDMMDINVKINSESNDSEELDMLKQKLEADLTSLTIDLDKDFHDSNTEKIRQKLGRLKFISNSYETLLKRHEKSDEFSFDEE